MNEMGSLTKPELMERNKKRVVLAYGHFNTIHAGHIRYLRHAKAQGDCLLVAVKGDKNIKYHFNREERAEGLRLLGLADGLILLEGGELCETIKDVKPDLLVLGTEMRNDTNINEIMETLKTYSGQLSFHAGDVRYTGAELLDTRQRDICDGRKDMYIRACNRSNVDKKKMVEAISAWVNTRLIVVGDSIVDQYWACEALGLSAEAPVVVVKELEKKEFIGGAAIVAAHIKAIGASCDFVSVVGNDDEGAYIRNCVEGLGIGCHLIVDRNRPTTLKKRYMVDSQKLFRVSRLENNPIDRDAEEEMLKKINRLAKKANGIVISDFVYGVVTPGLIDGIRNIAEKNSLKLFGDVQCSSQVGDISRFRDFTLLTPNEKELRIALQDEVSGIEALSRKLLKETRSENLLVKLAGDGFVAYGLMDGEMSVHAFPALCVTPLDVTGAGDSVLAAMSVSIASKQDMMLASAIGACMAALAVGTMGNTPINADRLTEQIELVMQ